MVAIIGTGCEDNLPGLVEGVCVVFEVETGVLLEVCLLDSI